MNGKLRQKSKEMKTKDKMNEIATRLLEIWVRLTTLDKMENRQQTHPAPWQEDK